MKTLISVKHIPIILALGRYKIRNQQEASLGYMKPCLKKDQKAGHGGTSIIPAIRRRGRMVPCEFKASLVYKVCSRPVRAPQLHRETMKIIIIIKSLAVINKG